MKQIEKNETTKNQVRDFVTEIVKLNNESVTFYIPISDENELILDELNVNLCDEWFEEIYKFSLTLDESKQYLKVYLNDFKYDIESKMNLEVYKTKYGIMYTCADEYKEEKKSIKEKLIEEKTIPAVIDAINKAIEEYNDVNGNSEGRKREVYTLKDGFMPTYFKGFEFEYKVNRICVAKVIDKEKDYINWIAKKGYNLNNIQRGDILMVKKMEPFKNRDLDKIFYKVISISKDKLICEYAHGDKVYTTYLKALKG